MTTVFWADATEREITGVAGLISALEAWHRWWADRWGFRRGLELGAEVRNIVVPFSQSFNAEVEGVVGLICAIYAWREWWHRRTMALFQSQFDPCPTCHHRPFLACDCFGN